MATNGITPPTNERPNYFAGQYLLEDDFQLEQEYHIDRQRWHHHLLHISGIAEGLKVTKGEGDLVVNVSEGSAIDSQGQQIVLLGIQKVDLTKTVSSNNSPISDGTYTLYIGYSDQKVDQQTPGNEITSRRWQEIPKFQLSSSDLKDFIPLAKLTINNSVVSDNIDNSVRVYSGLRLPSLDGEISLRFTPKDGTNNLAEFKGSLSVTGNVFVTSNITASSLIVTEATNLNGNIIIGTGTNTPLKKVQIESGELRVKASHNNETADIGAFYANNLSQGIGIGYNRIESIGSNANQDILIRPKGSGKVAINTTLEIAIDPTSEATVLKAGGVSRSKANIDLSGHIQLKEYGTENLAYLQARDDSSNRDIGLRIRTQKAGNTQRQLIEALTISPNGNVGIGTTAPSGFQIVLPESSKSSSLPSAGVTIAGGASGNASIELRNSGTGTPYIDFTQDATKTDYDARIRLIEPGKLAIEGANINVDGIIQAKGYKTAIFTAGGLNEPEVTLSSQNPGTTWFDFPSLSQTFTLSAPATVIAFYKISMENQQTNNQFVHLVTRLFVDNTDVSRTITGNTLYWGNNDFWVGELAQGEHTIKVQYRTPATGAKNTPRGTDWQNRVLRVMIFGS